MGHGRAFWAPEAFAVHYVVALRAQQLDSGRTTACQWPGEVGAQLSRICKRTRHQSDQGLRLWRNASIALWVRSGMHPPPSPKPSPQPRNLSLLPPLGCARCLIQVTPCSGQGQLGTLNTCTFPATSRSPYSSSEFKLLPCQIFSRRISPRPSSVHVCLHTLRSKPSSSWPSARSGSSPATASSVHQRAGRD